MQSTFLAAIPATPTVKKLCKTARDELARTLLNPKSAGNWLTILVGASPFQHQYLVLLAVVLGWYLLQSEPVKFPCDLYLNVVKLFVTSVLGSRSPPVLLIIVSCTEIFKKVTHSIFKEVLLPVMASKLRNLDELMASKFSTGSGADLVVRIANTATPTSPPRPACVLIVVRGRVTKTRWVWWC